MDETKCLQHCGAPCRAQFNVANQGCDKIALWLWLNDLTCSGEKTKLLGVGTRENRQLTVCGDLVNDTLSETLLGIVVNKTATWEQIYSQLGSAFYRVVIYGLE